MQSQIPLQVFYDLSRALVVWKESLVSSPCIFFLGLFCVSSNLPPVKLQSLVHHMSQVVRSVFHFTVHQSIHSSLICLDGCCERLGWKLCYSWTISAAVPLPADPEGLLVRQDLPLVKLCRQFPATFLGLGLHSRRICSITISVCSFPGPFLSLLVEVWHVACLVPVHLPH